MMTGKELRSIRSRLNLSEWEFYKLLYGPGDARDKAKKKIRQFEHDTRPIPPLTARCATLTMWWFESHNAIPAWEDI